MAGEINLLSFQLSWVASLLLMNYFIIGICGQYVYNPARSVLTPVASSPIADSTNPYVYNYETNRVGHMAQPPLKPVAESAPPPHGCRQPPELPPTYTPAPVYGPPGGLKKSEDTGDFFIFVPAFPSSSLASEGDPIGAAPAPGGGANGVGFVPPDGALFAPPPPLVNGTPLPSPRASTRHHPRTYYRR